MKKINIILIGVGGTLFLLIFMVLLRPLLPSTLFCFLDVGSHRIPNDRVEINRLNRYGQTFTPNFDHLFMMTIFIPKQNLFIEQKGEQKGKLHFHLKENKNKNSDLVHLQWKFSDIKPSRYSFYPLPPDSEVVKEGFHFSFQFPVIKMVREKKMYFYFDSSSQKGEGIKIGRWNHRPYYEALTKGTLFHNDKAQSGFLAFRTFHTLEGSFMENFSLAIQRIKVKLKKEMSFIVIYSILLLMISIFYIKTYVSC